MKYYLFSFIIITLSSCAKAPCNCDVIDANIEILVENSQGENLLVKTTPGSIDWNDLKLFYLAGNEPIEVYHSNYDCPRNICFVDEPGHERLNITANIEGTEDNTIALLRWNDQDTDTIRCHIVRKNNNAYRVVDKVWYNEVLQYPDNAVQGFARAFKIVK